MEKNDKMGQQCDKKKSRIRNEHLIGNLWMAPIEGKKKKKSKNAV